MTGPSQIDAPPPRASAAPEITSGSRGPCLPTRRPVSGETNTIITPTGSRHSPAMSAVMPRTSCRYRVVTNRNAPNAHNPQSAMTIAALNGTLRNSRNSSNGSARRGS